MDRWDKLAIVKQKVALLTEETELLLIPKVAIYEREVLVCEEGIVTLTDHRILWRDGEKDVKSMSLSLSLVKSFNLKSGFLTSSPKVILHLANKSSQSPLHPTSNVVDSVVTGSVSVGWKCEICDEMNNENNMKCDICGVPRKKRQISTTDVKDVKWCCHICTFSNNIIDNTCEMCGTPKQQIINTTENADSNTNDNAYLKLSFRGSGASNFYAHLQMVMQKQIWKVMEAALSTKSTIYGSSVGVAGLLKQVNTNQKQTDEDLSVAFTDLDALMSKASGLVKLAVTLSNRVDNNSEGEPVEEVELRKMMSQLGVSSTIETTSNSSNTFTTELAKSVADFTERLLKQKGILMLPLADVYCLYNRSRGSNLISPQDLYESVMAMQRLECLNVVVKRLPTGLLLLQTRQVSDESLLSRLRGRLSNIDVSIDALEYSRIEGLSLTIAIMYLKEAEVKGIICRDTNPSGHTSYYQNIFLL